MDIINKYHTSYLNINSLSGYKADNKYYIIVENDGIVESLAVFSHERKCCQTQGITLVKDDDIQQYLNKPFGEIEEEIGIPHLDLGSGFYIPSYITENAYLISLELVDGFVSEVIKRDLIENNITEQINIRG